MADDRFVISDLLQGAEGESSAMFKEYTELQEHNVFNQQMQQTEMAPFSSNQMPGEQTLTSQTLPTPGMAFVNPSQNLPNPGMAFDNPCVCTGGEEIEGGSLTAIPAGSQSKGRIILR